MSSSVELVIEGKREDLPTEADLQRLLGIEGRLSLANADEYVEQLEDVPARVIVQWWDEKYGVDAAAIDDCVDISEQYPLVTVHLEDEWDDDGIGGAGWEWKNGRKIKSGGLEWVWEDLT